MVYDGIGKSTFATSLECLRSRVGASSGAPDPVAVGTLNAEGSLFLTRPGLAHHATDADEYRERALCVFDAAKKGIIKPAIWKTFPLAEAAEAHAALEGRKSAGAIVLKP
ncbi:NADPH2:quinone reductase [Bradyrhizobium sp. Rc2d]|uniref:zinc-binding dehydrogenase n=1 Tax=Bradyrhizobium sp. Rc2d TaxID=1855321 RepID=UPI000886230C|nr:zinc-binding dehydrogenase [Bradyrhizobium sp. Rc2d]SDH88731.1 NADPH2:quinone reductase [Bradyrhizobium sp. Rc2d]